MKYSQILKTLVFGVLAIAMVGMLFVPSFQQKTTANNESVNPEYVARVKEALGDLELLTLSGVSPTESRVRNEISSISRFVEERAGMRISPLVSQKLIEREMGALSGKEQGVSFQKLVNTLADLGLQRIAKCSDEEIDITLETLKGFNSPELPESAKSSRTDISYRPGRYIQIGKEEAIKQIKAVSSPDAQLFFKPTLRSFIEKEAKDTLRALATASPEKFGSNWDFKTDEPAKNLTPAQSFLLSYSLVSGDLLSDNKANLELRMQKKQQFFSKIYGSYPSPAGHSAYGSNGYLYPSPLEIFFSEKEQLQLISKLTEVK
jgi:hypothetical protein